MKNTNTKSISQILCALLLMLTGTCTPLYAANYTRDIDRSKIVAPTDEEMFEWFLEVVREGSIDRKYLDDEQIAFSERLKAAARKGEGITLIKPIASNHDYFAPEFQKALDEARQGRCVDWDMHRDGRLDEWREYGLLALHPVPTREQREKYEEVNGYALIRHYDFKLYSVDIDHDHGNGKELLLYGAGVNQINHIPSYAVVGNFFGRYAEYMLPDLKSCEHISYLSVDDPINPDTLASSGNITGVFEFDGKSYVFHGHSFSTRMTLFIMGWNKTRNTLASMYGYFTWKIKAQ